MHKKKLSICFVTEDFYPNFIGGQGVYGKELVTGLARQGMAVTVLAENRGGRRRFWDTVGGVQVFLVPYCFGNQLLLALFEYVYFIVQLHSKQFDILHANQLTGLLFVLFRPKNIGKIVVTVHNTWDQMAVCSRSRIKQMLYSPLAWLETIVFRHADGLVFHTKTCQAQVLKRDPGRMSVVVPLGAPSVHTHTRDVNEARRMIRKQLGLSQDTALVLSAGRLVRRKNIETILHALRRLHAQGRPIAGVIIGEGADRRRLEHLTPFNVRFLGFVPDTRLYFLAADMFVLPSVAEGGVALSVLEAAAYGLPLLVSSEACDDTILVHGKNGYVIDPYDGDALAGFIERIAHERKALGEESKRKAGQLTWQRCVQGTVGFYGLLLGKHAGRR